MNIPKLIKKMLKGKYIQYHKRFFITNPLTYFNLFLLDHFMLIYYYIKNYRAMFSEFKKTYRLKNSMRGYKAFVFGNGPSLKRLDFKKVSKYQSEYGFKVFCINSFIGDGKNIDLVPDYYVLSDPAYFGFSEGISEERRLEIEKNLEALSNFSSIDIFIPINFYGKLNLPNQIYYFNDCEYRWLIKQATNILLPRGYLSMTAYKALAIACFMGFDKIYILGFDNDWIKSLIVDDKNNIWYKNLHFKEQADTGIHLVKNEEAKNIAELLLSFSYLFEDLYLFPKDKIVNLDPLGLVDAFSKNHELDIYKND